MNEIWIVKNHLTVRTIIMHWKSEINYNKRLMIVGTFVEPLGRCPFKEMVLLTIGIPDVDINCYQLRKKSLPALCAIQNCRS